MFTGIVEAVGTLAALTPQGADVRVTVNSGKLDLSDVRLGDSIATNGVCLTVVALTAQGYQADLSLETLQRSAFADYHAGQALNLEKALTLNTRLGGHLVSGHVDGVAQVLRRQDLGRAIEFWLRAPAELARYLSEKGSVTLDGISLTINAVDGADFKITLVPHTQQETTTQNWQAGSRINLEVDLLARYLERLLLGERAAESSAANAGGVSMDLLARSGFLR